MRQEKLNKILEKHEKWLNYETDGERANLCGADLHGADFFGADLCGANLRGANLHGADLRGADLRGANLHGADLRGADLRGADLFGADLFGADLFGADLRGAKNVPFIPKACPSHGEFVGWKVCYTPTKDGDRDVLVKLLIPEDARKLSATGRKCRCDKAKVLSIESFDGKDQYEKAYSYYDYSFVYEDGKTVEPREPFCEDRWDECSSGIHFYINREEAVNNG